MDRLPRPGRLDRMQLRRRLDPHRDSVQQLNNKGGAIDHAPTLTIAWKKDPTKKTRNRMGNHRKNMKRMQRKDRLQLPRKRATTMRKTRKTRRRRRLRRG